MQRRGPSVALVVITLLSNFVSPRPAAAECNNGVGPDCVDQAYAVTGTFDFFATGASLTFNDDADDRPDGALDLASVTIPERRIPARAQLVQAYLYFGGSLYADGDGNDAPDTSVELKVPGASDFAVVTGDQVHQSGAIPGFPEVTLYAVRADITELMRASGGTLPGTYELRGFNADIFHGAQEHTAANASFSIVLVFEEARLSPRTIVLFDGMQEVLGSTVTLPLSGFLVSPVPSGSLTFYALEGDCNPGPMDCENGNNLAGAERVQVIGGEPSRVITLSDSFNPPNDIFNRTINTVEPPLRNVVGTDIDAFDITPVLRPGDQEVTVEITTPNARAGASGELIGLAYVIVGINVFAPELRFDSRIEIASQEGEILAEYAPGDPLQVTYAISNTGNLPGTGVRVEADLPANVTRFEVLREPTGSMVMVEASGGAAGKGRVVVSDLSVRHGEVRSLVLLVETECPLPQGGTLTLSASVSAAREGGSAFSMTSSTSLTARDRCGPSFFLYGGGGCSAAPMSPRPARWPLFLLLGVAVILRRRRSVRPVLGLLALALLATACGGEVDPEPDQAAPPTFGVPCPADPDMVVIPSIRNRPPFCIGRFEASSTVGVLGNADQSSAGETGDGSTTVRVESKRFSKPLSGVSWFQANAACRGAGKRLCTADEWLTACRGSTDTTYPYGDDFHRLTCNGFDAARGAPVETGAMFTTGLDAQKSEVALGCVTEHGAYDMSGNVWEWNADSYFNGTRRGLAGGGFRSNEIGLRCVTEDNHAEPAENRESYGFRCCADYVP